MYVILGFSENLLEEMDPVAVQEQASEVLQAAKRIITICKDLNLYAHQNTLKECVPVTLTQQLEEAMKVAKFASGLENMKIVRDYSADPVILARPEAIVQICVNLIINALQAMNGQGTLTLGARSTDQVASISIGDTGPGIPPEKMDKIFEPFYTTKPPGQGTGLGLHSVRSLVQEYGGQVLIQSTMGQGTTFHLEFPCNLKNSSRTHRNTPLNTHDPTSVERHKEQKVGLNHPKGDHAIFDFLCIINVACYIYSSRSLD